MAKILIVDDAAFMRMMIKDVITKNGYEVAGEAVNGMDAVDKYNELKPDLVLMDITMPEKATGMPRLLCALLWVSRLWLSRLSSREPRTLSLNPSSRRGYLKQFRKY